MPRIDEDKLRQHRLSWQEVQNLIFENLFFSYPEDKEKLKKEIDFLIEEAKKNVCETYKREDDRKSS